ncbi:MAG: hypothetical protein AAGJ46_08530 [Planctomycetota bacterium]
MPVLDAHRAARFLGPVAVLLLSCPIVLANDFFSGPAAVQGEPMFFSIYSVLKEQRGNFNLQTIADGGFTTAGPHYLGSNGGDPLSHPTVFYSRAADAAEAGLGSIGHITWHPDVVNDTSGFVRGESMDAIAEADIRAHVRQVMDFTLNDPATNAATQKWYTMPEELRPWRAGEMRYLSIVADEIRSYDPQGRPISMYSPNNRKASELIDLTEQGLDETLMGVYVTGEPFATRGPRVALGADRIVTAARETSTTAVMGMQLSTDLDTAELNALRAALGGVSNAEAIQHVIRHDAYQGILRGIEGIHIWSGCDCRSGLSTYTEQLDAYASVSADMNNNLGLADVFLHGDWRDDLTATVFSGPTTVTYDGNLGEKTVDSVTIADIAYGGDRYLFLANASNTQLAVRVDGAPSGLSATQFSDLFDNAPELVVNGGTGEVFLGLQPLEVVGLKIVPGPAGDYNGDGVVNAADYTVWRDALGGGELPNNETATVGVVDGADHALWAARFSDPAAAITASKAPSPGSGVLFAVVVAWWSCGRRARNTLP